MEIVREGHFVEETFKHNRSINMNRSTMRPDFVSAMGSQMNDGRFNLNDFYDKSSYLSKVPRPKQIIDFSTVTERDKDLIDKGGDAGVKIGGKCSKFYDENTKISATMKRLDAGMPKMNKSTNRSTAFGSMYKQEDDFTPDHYNGVKIAEKAMKLKTHAKPFVDMKKQTKREYSKLLQGTDFYNNI